MKEMSTATVLTIMAMAPSMKYLTVLWIIQGYAINAENKYVQANADGVLVPIRENAAPGRPSNKIVEIVEVNKELVRMTATGVPGSHAREKENVLRIAPVAENVEIVVIIAEPVWATARGAHGVPVREKENALSLKYKPVNADIVVIKPDHAEVIAIGVPGLLAKGQVNARPILINALHHRIGNRTIVRICVFGKHPSCAYHITVTQQLGYAFCKDQG